MTAITVADLTQTTLEGTGIFDTLMRANKVHLEAEFGKGRIKGTEYATVYLGSLSQVLQSSMQFLLQKDLQTLQSQLLAQQILLAEVEVQKATAELAIIQASVLKVPAEIAQLTAQTELTQQQKLNVTAEALNIPKQGLILDGQKCKLDAEYDLLLNENLKTGAEITLLTQKVMTERAQTIALGIDDNSVLGKQKALYAAQTAGFARNAEQQAAQIMVDSWKVRRTTATDEPVDVNGLDDWSIKRAVDKLLGGVGA